MRERATLKLDSGDELRVEVERDDLALSEFVVRLVRSDDPRPTRNLLEVVDAHLATAEPAPAGTTDRLRAGDRDRPY